MNSPEENNSLNELFSGMINAVSSGISSYLNSYLIGMVSQVIGLPNKGMEQFSSMDELIGYVQNAVRQSMEPASSQYPDQKALQASESGFEPDLMDKTESGNPDKVIPSGAIGSELLNPGSKPNDTPIDLQQMISDCEESNRDSSGAYSLPDEKALQDSKPQSSVIKTIDIQPHVMETHENIIIRIIIPYGVSPDSLRLQINEDHVAVKWEKGYMQQIIRIPPDTITDQANAVLIGNILEIKIPRINTDHQRFMPISRL